MAYASVSSVNGGASQDSQNDKILSRAKSEAATASSSRREDAKIQKAGKDFESILIGNWLQQAEQSFAKVPGGDGEEDDDSSKDQFQGIAMQALAGSLTDHGGIGIAKMIVKHLQSSAQGSTDGPNTEKKGV